MEDLQVANPQELRMIAFIEADAGSVVEMETEVHRAFRADRVEGVGEWWAFDERMVTPLFRLVAEAVGADIVKEVGDTTAGFVQHEEARQDVSSHLHYPIGKQHRKKC
jgi:hypothetical protein